jgi:hypothetical protein
VVTRVERGDDGWPLLIEAGPVSVVISGTIYRFSIRVGRVIDLAVWERKDA